MFSKRDPVSGASWRIKKLFDGSEMVCALCAKKGHMISFCPSKATCPREEDRSAFVDKLVNSPRVRLEIYKGLSWEGAWEKFSAYGAELNKENPWCSENGPEFHLKKNLGFWKAIGADRDVMSWVGYGVDVNFVTPLSRLWFANSKATLAHESFIEKELAGHLEDGLARVIAGPSPESDDSVHGDI